MKFSMEELNPGTWFDLDEENSEKGSICIRVMNTATRSKLSSLCTKKIEKFKKGQRYEITKFDDIRWDKEFYDYVIVDWKGLEDEKGTPIPCTAENKLKLATESVVFLNILTDAMDKLNEAQEEQEEATEKN